MGGVGGVVASLGPSPHVRQAWTFSEAAELILLERFHVNDPEECLPPPPNASSSPSSAAA